LYKKPRGENTQNGKTGTMTNFKRLVAFGCSHTAGDEIADHTVLGLSFQEYHDEVKKIINSESTFKQQMVKSNEVFWNDKHLLLKRNNLNRSLSWSSKLARKLNLGNLNMSRGGNSMSNIFFEIVDQFNKHNLFPNDLIVIGLTHLHRYTVFTPNTELYFQKEKRESQCITELSLEPHERKNIQHIYNHEQFVWIYYNTLKQIEQFSLANNLTVMMFPIAGRHELDPYFEGWLGETRIKNINYHAKWCWKTLMPNILMGNIGLHYFNLEQIYCVWGHYPESNHELYAEYACQLIKQHKLFKQ